ncbi:hypothetical protein ACEQPO_02355 [Bacillus sp. SL00103]
MQTSVLPICWKTAGQRFFHTKGLTAPTSFTGHVLLIEDAIEGEAQEMQVHVKPTDLAYMIYTSGTTGTAEGCHG